MEKFRSEAFPGEGANRSKMYFSSPKSGRSCVRFQAYQLWICWPSEDIVD